MKNRLINKLIIYFVIIFGISTFSCFPKSYSKYIKDETPATFYVGIDKLYIGELENLSPTDKSTYQNARYKIKFYRSQVMKDNDDSQIITIKVKQAACRITAIDSKGVKTFNNNIATIKYTSKGEDFITVDYDCPVEDITVLENGINYIYSNVEVYEKFMPENIEYLYTKGDGPKQTLATYYSLYPKPSNEIYQDSRNLIIPGTFPNIYDAFINWINTEYITSLSDDYDTEIKEYIETVYSESNKDSIIDLSKHLKGLTVTYDSVNDKYKYTIDENFLGYARTYYAYVGPQAYMKAYFSNDSLTDSESNEIFKYYLEEYTNYTEENINKIISYISNYGSLNYIIKPDVNGTYKSILGFEYNSETKEIQVSKYLGDYSYSVLDNKIYINNTDLLSMEMYKIFSDLLPVIYDDISIGLLNKIANNTNVFQSIIKNNKNVNPKIIYNDYFTVNNLVTIDSVPTYEYALVKIYSDGVNGYTFVEIVEIGNADNITITKNDNQLDLSITLNNIDIVKSKNNLTNIITKLDNYFGLDYKNDIIDDLFTTSITNNRITSVIDGNNIIISLSIIL